MHETFSCFQLSLIVQYGRFGGSARSARRAVDGLRQGHDAVLDIGLFALGRAVKFDVSDFCLLYTSDAADEL